MTLFNATDYARLHTLVFAPNYPGYRPDVIEAPAGDAARQDTGQRYAHVAAKYLRQYDGHPSDHSMLHWYLTRAHGHAVQVALRLGVPEAFLPSYEHGALRVLEYPPGTGSHRHTDVGLLTTLCYRNVPGLVRSMSLDALNALDAIEPGLHLGRIAREIGLTNMATPHYVAPVAEVQHSIVYFAVPNHEAILPSGERLGTWLDAQMAKMRYDRPDNSTVKQIETGLDSTPGKGGPG